MWGVPQNATGEARMDLPLEFLFFFSQLLDFQLRSATDADALWL